MPHQAQAANAEAVLRTEEFPQAAVLRALAAGQIPDWGLQVVTLEHGVVQMRLQVLGAEGYHAGEARLDRNSPQAMVAGHSLCGFLLRLASLPRRRVQGLAILGLTVRRPQIPEAVGLLHLLHYCAQHRILLQLWPHLEASPALGAKELGVLDCPGLVQAARAKVVTARSSNGLLEDFQADGAGQLVSQRLQLGHRDPYQIDAFKEDN